MKANKLTLLLIALCFDLASFKRFEQCEFAQELVNAHKIPIDKVYMHLCIGSNLHTAQDKYSTYLGIYEIGTDWWCGKKSPGGSCNIKCSDLLDDDITDDVACANIILSSHGLLGWEKTEADCRKKFGHTADDCLAELVINADLRQLGVSAQPKTITSKVEDVGISSIVITIVILAFLFILIVAAAVKREQVKHYINSKASPKVSHEFENSMTVLVES